MIDFPRPQHYMSAWMPRYPWPNPDTETTPVLDGQTDILEELNYEVPPPAL